MRLATALGHRHPQHLDRPVELHRPLVRGRAELVAVHRDLVDAQVAAGVVEVAGLGDHPVGGPSAGGERHRRAQVRRVGHPLHLVAGRVLHHRPPAAVRVVVGERGLGVRAVHVAQRHHAAAGRPVVRVHVHLGDVHRRAGVERLGGRHAGLQRGHMGQVGVGQLLVADHPGTQLLLGEVEQREVEVQQLVTVRVPERGQLFTQRAPGQRVQVIQAAVQEIRHALHRPAVESESPHSHLPQRGDGFQNGGIIAGPNSDLHLDRHAVGDRAPDGGGRLPERDRAAAQRVVHRRVDRVQADDHLVEVAGVQRGTERPVEPAGRDRPVGDRHDGHAGLRGPAQLLRRALRVHRRLRAEQVEVLQSGTQTVHLTGEVVPRDAQPGLLAGRVRGRRQARAVQPLPGVAARAAQLAPVVTLVGDAEDLPLVQPGRLVRRGVLAHPPVHRGQLVRARVHHAGPVLHRAVAVGRRPGDPSARGHVAPSPYVVDESAHAVLPRLLIQALLRWNGNNDFVWRYQCFP